MPKVFEIQGMDKVNKFLSGFDYKINKRLMNSGLSKTASIVKRQMKTNLAGGKGGSKLTQFIRIWQGKKTRRALKWVGFQKPKMRTIKQRERFATSLKNQSGSTDRARRSWLNMGAYWLEFGTLSQMTIPRAASTRTLSEAVERTGGRAGARIAPIRWFSKAVNSKMEPMVNDFANNMGKAIDQFMKKYGW